MSELQKESTYSEDETSPASAIKENNPLNLTERERNKKIEKDRRYFKDLKEEIEGEIGK